MILPSCPWFSLVVRQDHDRIMFCVQAHGLLLEPCACVVLLCNSAPLLPSSCHYCLVSFCCPRHSVPFMIPLCLLSCVSSLFDTVILSCMLMYCEYLVSFVWWITDHLSVVSLSSSLSSLFIPCQFCPCFTPSWVLFSLFSVYN